MFQQIYLNRLYEFICEWVASFLLKWMHLCTILVFSKCFAKFAIWQTFIWDRNCFVPTILGVCLWCINLWMYLYINSWKISFIKLKNMHLQFQTAVFKPSQGALVSLQFGKRHLEKTRLLKEPSYLILLKICSWKWCFKKDLHKRCM